jgi:hypothetical protein
VASASATGATRVRMAIMGAIMGFSRKIIGL